MPDYTITAELGERSSALEGDRLDALLHTLEPWHVAIGTSPHGNAEARLTIPADDLLQAVATARAVLATTGAEYLAVSAIETHLGETREADERIPDLVDLPEAAEIIGVSRPAAAAMVDRGELAHTAVGKRGTVVLRASAERLRDARAAKAAR